MALSVLSEKFDSSVITNKFTDPQTENEMKMSILAVNVAKGIDNHENRISQNERKIEEMQKMIDKLQSMIDGKIILANPSSIIVHIWYCSSTFLKKFLKDIHLF